MAKKSPDKYDIEVGKRIKALRMARGISQEQVGAYLGLTFQQVQKYEKGTNRIAPSRLIPLAKLLKVEPAALIGGGNGHSETIDTRLTTTGRRRVVEALVSINNTRVENALADLLETLRAK